MIKDRQLNRINIDFCKEIIPEARLILLLAEWTVYGRDLPEIKDLIEQGNIKWERFNEFILYHELSSFSYPCFKKYLYLLPAKEVDLLKKNYYFYLIYAHYLWQEFMEIIRLFNKENIKFVPLKGIAFLVDNLYADKAYLRPMCDIDLLVKENDLSLVEKLLETLDYRKDLKGMEENYWRRENYHLVFTKKNIKGLFCNVEMHWALDYKRRKPLLLSLWNRIKKTQVENKEVYMLSPEDTLFSLALHQRRFGKMLCLKNVCDVVKLLNRYNADIDWDYILKETKLASMSTTLYFILAQANLLFDIQVPFSLLEALNVPGYKKQLIRRFIAQDTFSSSSGLSNGHKSINNFYLKSHFLLYDNFWEPVRAVLNVPHEQFAKFYRLHPYAVKTKLLYRIRYLYFLQNIFMDILKIMINRLLGFLKRLLGIPCVLLKG